MISVLKNFGKLGEIKASNFLIKKGYSIISKNYSTRYGEIDIIAQKNRCIYFIEVKTRSNDSHGMPYEAVNYTKINHMKKAADYFLLKNQYKDFKLKLSVISIIIANNEITKLDFFEDIS